VILPSLCPCAPAGKKTGEVAGSSIDLQPPFMSPLISRNMELASRESYFLNPIIKLGTRFYRRVGAGTKSY
jgi:hypothetical protein